MRASPFFEGVSQVQLAASGHRVPLPIFYYEGRAVTTLFPASLAALRRALPDRRFVPARLAPGVGVVGVSVFEYVDTDLGPYNELAIAIVLHDPPHVPNLPGVTLARMQRTRQLHAWVHHLPVTTEIAWAAGRTFYNYPKFVAGIAFDDAPGRIRCRLSEGGHDILTLTAEAVPASRPADIQLFSHLWMDRQPQSSEFKLRAEAMGERLRPGGASLQLSGEHPIARELDGMLLSRQALYVQHLARFEGILYGPEHLSLPMVARLQTAAPGERLEAPR